ncbi:hypothetical protein CC1G_12969 [Coprinopsis cinerea okayama7|uniref:Uncharacterized protein n=1 Tax=Coprinopsis cinerea (strain Okayama-7 / 130 / ATCC MYA-4618 / FGSC 9003) TaxID=240176 RepID=A8PCN3_COPC7|nr:hypothetical protein CC1G_12969 [Coprinopsis cinerea okayama7\|eukprot:XP_001840440.2 hypothetical protein CC1G_12969 [Coprinopsis cinerea okayama7\
MPAGFCTLQAVFIALGTFIATGVVATFSYITSSIAAKPKSWASPNHPAFSWKHAYLLPTAIFPAVATSIYIACVLKYNSVTPVRDFFCDSSTPQWIRFLSYAGTPLLLSLPALALSTHSLLRVRQTTKHIKRARTGELDFAFGHAGSDSDDFGLGIITNTFHPRKREQSSDSHSSESLGLALRKSSSSGAPTPTPAPSSAPKRIPKVQFHIPLKPSAASPAPATKHEDAEGAISQEEHIRLDKLNNRGRSGSNTSCSSEEEEEDGVRRSSLPPPPLSMSLGVDADVDGNTTPKPSMDLTDLRKPSLDSKPPTKPSLDLCTTSQHKASFSIEGAPSSDSSHSHFPSHETGDEITSVQRTNLVLESGGKRTSLVELDGAPKRASLVELETASSTPRRTSLLVETLTTPTPDTLLTPSTAIEIEEMEVKWKVGAEGVKGGHDAKPGDMKTGDKKAAGDDLNDDEDKKDLEYGEDDEEDDGSISEYLSRLPTTRVPPIRTHAKAFNYFDGGDPRTRTSIRKSRPPPAYLSPPIWRTIVFQMYVLRSVVPAMRLTNAFTLSSPFLATFPLFPCFTTNSAFTVIQSLGTLSTLIDVASNRAQPTPLGTHHFALLFVVWGPIFAFASLPQTKQHLIPPRLRFLKLSPALSRILPTRRSTRSSDSSPHRTSHRPRRTRRPSRIPLTLFKKTSSSSEPFTFEIPAASSSSSLNFEA